MVMIIHLVITKCLFKSPTFIHETVLATLTWLTSSIKAFSMEHGPERV